jgi:hypothetical protein
MVSVLFGWTSIQDYNDHSYRHNLSLGACKKCAEPKGACGACGCCLRVSCLLVPAVGAGYDIAQKRS